MLLVLAPPQQNRKNPARNIQNDLNEDAQQDSMHNGASNEDQGNNPDSLIVPTVGNSGPSSGENSSDDSETDKEIENSSEEDDNGDGLRKSGR